MGQIFNQTSYRAQTKNEKQMIIMMMKAGTQNTWNVIIMPSWENQIQG